MKKILLSATALVSLGLTGAAYGQSVNYTSLQDLFGEPVTTSATGKPQRQSEAPASMIIITGAELRRSGARTIPDILQNHAGMDVNRFSTNQQEVTVRGGALPINPRLLVLVNGRQVYIDPFGYTDWSLLGIEMAEIQQIEVVKGPNTALFGFNAAAGVVNIITVDPLYRDNQVSANVEGGTKGTYGLSLAGTFKLGANTGIRLSAGQTENDEWASLGSTTNARRRNAAGELTSQIGDKVRATLGYTYANSNHLMHGFAYIPHDSEQTLQGVKGVVAADTAAGLIKAQVSYDTVDQRTFLPPIFDYRLKSSLFNVKLEDVFKIGTRHSVRIGAEYRRSELDNISSVVGSEVIEDTAGQTRYDVYSGSAMWEWQASEKLTLTTAGRMDVMELGHGPINEPLNPLTAEDYDLDHTLFSYNASLSYAMDDLNRIRFSAARGLQTPSLGALGISIYFVNNGMTFYKSGNPELEASVTKSYELAFDHSIPSIGGGFNIVAATSSIDGFMATSFNNVFVGSTGQEIILLEHSIGDFKTYSIEATLHGKALGDALGWSVNYTWTQVDENFSTEILNQALTLDEATPRHKINARLDYQRGNWNAYLTGRYRSATTQRIWPFLGSEVGAENYAHLKGSVIVDARIGYQLGKGWSVWASGENLTSNSNAGLSAFGADRRFLAGFSLNY